MVRCEADVTNATHGSVGLYHEYAVNVRGNPLAPSIPLPLAHLHRKDPCDAIDGVAVGHGSVDGAHDREVLPRGVELSQHRLQRVLIVAHVDVLRVLVGVSEEVRRVQAAIQYRCVGTS